MLIGTTFAQTVYNDPVGAVSGAFSEAYNNPLTSLAKATSLAAGAFLVDTALGVYAKNYKAPALRFGFATFASAGLNYFADKQKALFSELLQYSGTGAAINGAVKLYAKYPVFAKNQGAPAVPAQKND